MKMPASCRLSLLGVLLVPVVASGDVSVPPRDAIVDWMRACSSRLERARAEAARRSASFSKGSVRAAADPPGVQFDLTLRPSAFPSYSVGVSMTMAPLDRAPIGRWSQEARTLTHPESGWIASVHWNESAFAPETINPIWQKAADDCLSIRPNPGKAPSVTTLSAALMSLDQHWDHPSNEDARRVTAEVEKLLASGADPNVSFEYGGEPRYTALHWAAHDGNMVLVPLLVRAGANVNAVDSRGFTPLHSAAKCDFRQSCDDCTDTAAPKFPWKQGARPVIQYLIEHGADIKARTKAGQSLLDLVPPENCPKTFRFVKDRLSTGERARGNR
jgi:hypothetical protein